MKARSASSYLFTRSSLKLFETKTPSTLNRTLVKALKIRALTLIWSKPMKNQMRTMRKERVRRKLNQIKAIFRALPKS